MGEVDILGIIWATDTNCVPYLYECVLKVTELNDQLGSQVLILHSLTPLRGLIIIATYGKHAREFVTNLLQN